MSLYQPVPGSTEPIAMEPPPRPPPALPDEIVEEILLRFPPDDPASLLSAVLVCKPWCRVVAGGGGGFRRRFRQFHRRTPPMLGLLRRGSSVTHFVPTSSSSSFHGGDQHLWHATDASHGRVLLRSVCSKLEEPMVDPLVVWDPITGDRRELELPTPREYLYDRSWSAAVLCANGDDACDHLDCHRHGHFQVVVVGSDSKQIYACIYSSEAGSWSQPACSHLQDCSDYYLDYGKPSALVEDSLYFVLGNAALLKYNLASQEMSVIDLPPAAHRQYDAHLTAVDGRLGFATTENSKLQLWLREAGHDGNVGWTRSRVIDLKRLLPVDNLLFPTSSAYVVGLAVGIGFCFVHMGDAVFAIDLKSSQAKEVCNVSGSGIGHCSILPYMNFCTPSIGSVLYK